MSDIIITIDGPAGAGKSSVAKALARRLKIAYLDTGALYRAVALALNSSKILPWDVNNVERALRNMKVDLIDERVYVNGLDLSNRLRDAHVDRIVSAYAALSCVRSALFDLQRDQAKHGSLVAEGRDMGSAVFPDAKYKFYLTATPEARAQRRCLERKQRGLLVSYAKVLDAIKQRDEQDSSRETSPLCMAEGAVLIDSSNMTEDEVVSYIEGYVRKREA